MSLVLPYTFTANTKIFSAQVDANFSALQNAFNTNTRTILSTATTFYLSPTGSDTVSGLNPAQPAATINYINGLLDTIYDANNQQVSIQLANGTYNQSALLRGVGLGQYYQTQLHIMGATPNTPSLVTIVGAPCFQLNTGAQVYLDNMTLQSTSDCILSAGGASCVFTNLIFSTATGTHLHAIRGGQIYSGGNYQISGSAAAHAQAQGSGSVIYLEGIHDLTQPPPVNQPVITLSGTPNWSTGFVVAGGNASVFCTAQFAGSGATGSRGQAVNNGVINTLGNPNALTTYFPGSVNPTTLNGGLIV